LSLKAEFSGPAYQICYNLTIKYSYAKEEMLGEAKKWAAMAYEHGKISYKEKDERVVKWKKWSEHPEHPKDFVQDELVRAMLAHMKSDTR